MAPKGVAAFAGLIALLLEVEFAGLIALLEFEFGGDIRSVLSDVGAGVAARVGVGVAMLVGRLAFMFTLVAVSPQAMPRALKPRTVESTITFFILFRTPNLSQRIKSLSPGGG